MARVPVTKLLPAVRLSAYNQYVNLPYDASMNPGSGSFVMAIWYRPLPAATLDVGATHVIVETSAGDYTKGLFLNAFGPDLYVYVNFGGPIGSFPNALTAHVWHRIVVVGDAGAQTVKVYLNGTLMGTATSVTWNITSTDVIRIGASGDLPVAAPGDFAEFTFCKAGTAGFAIPDATAVTNDYNRTAPFAGRSAYYPLHEGTGTTITAAVGGGAAGSISGGGWKVSDRVAVASRAAARVGQNLLTRSEAFDHADWAKATGTTITADAVAGPFGYGLADTFVDSNDAGGENHYIYQVLGVTPAEGELLTLSVYSKPVAVSNNWLVLGGSGGAIPAWYDLTNGTVGTVGLGSASIASVGNGWYRCTISYGQTGAATVPVIYSATANGTVTYQGAGTNRFYLWGAQLTRSKTLVPYVPTTSAAVNSGQAVRGPTPGRVAA